ncbi:hypothetical protein ACFLRW_04975 [Acidobacteriota bacterium]
MRRKFRWAIFFYFFIFFLLPLGIKSQETDLNQISYNIKSYPVYPKTMDVIPDLPSPFYAKNGMEVLLAYTKNGKYILVPVTVENGNPLHYSRRTGTRYGKDQQLLVNSGDFPSFAKTGLHVEAELDKKENITGLHVSVITFIGRPKRFSGEGFLADDEDIISVLKADNHLVENMNLTHPQMAKPLFHVWNIILKEIEMDKFGRFSSIQYFFYNGEKVLLEAEGSKGWQGSIFQDEIQGRFNISVHHKISPEEKSYLKEKYPDLSSFEMSELENKLSNIHFSEMVPYYIMRYGFYEGHTNYRGDPIAIAFIFGLKSIEEIENAFKGNLYKTLTNHFTKEPNDF